MQNKLWWFVFTFVLLVYSLDLLQAQSEAAEIKGKSSLFFQILGPEVLGAHYNYNFHKNISANIGIGLNADAHAGVNFYPLKRTNPEYLTIYAGAQIISYHQFGGSEFQLGFYTPIGIEIYSMSARGLTIQIEGGPNIVKEDW